MTCPKCGTPGIVDAVQVTGSATTLTYTCSACHHQWAVTTAPPVIVP